MTGSDSESPSSSSSWQIEDRCCSCDCPMCHSSSLWRRSVKRKLGEMEGYRRLYLHPLSGAPSVDVLARVEFENERVALREVLSRQHKKIKDLHAELEEERNASFTAANEAMSMILRLQREKAEVQMEARQFKRFAEEKMAHDQQEILALEDGFLKRDQAVQVLSCEIESYKHHLMSYGIDPDSYAIDERGEVGIELDPNENNISDMNDNNDSGDTPVYHCPPHDYPPLRCSLPDFNMNDECIDLDKYVDSPLTPGNGAHEHFLHIEKQIHRMKKTSSSGNLDVLEKVVLVGDSPRWPRHTRQYSAKNLCSFLTRNFVQDIGDNRKRNDEFPAMVDRDSEADFRDDASDRVYTIDTVYAAPAVGCCNDHMCAPRGLGLRRNVGMDEPDIKTLYMRLQALEADRESLKQAIVSMQTDKAQLVLLKEIARNLCEGVKQPTLVPGRRLPKRVSLLRSLSLTSVFKWIVSFTFWEKKTVHSKHAFGLSNNSAGLLFLLDKFPHTRPWRRVARP